MLHLLKLFSHARRGRVLHVAVSSALLLGVMTAAVLVKNTDITPQVRLSGGSAWLVSPTVAAVSLVDGPAEQVVASLRLDAKPNEDVSVTQAGTDAYVVNHTEGTVARIDGATQRLGQARKFADTPGALRLMAGPNALYALDAKRGLVVRVDPRTLASQSELSLAAQPGIAQSVVDQNGMLWVVDGSRGGLVWTDGSVKREAPESTARNTQLVLVRDRPVLADLTAGKLHSLDEKGGITSSTCLDVRNGVDAQFLGSATQDTVYTAVSDTGTLLVSATGSDDCRTSLSVSHPGDVLGTPVASARFLFIPNFTTGKTVIVDTDARRVLSSSLALVGKGHRFALIAKDGLVFYNDLDGDEAGVVTYDGVSWQAGKALSKFNPNTREPANLDATSTRNILKTSTANSLENSSEPTVDTPTSNSTTGLPTTGSQTTNPLTTASTATLPTTSGTTANLFIPASTTPLPTTSGATTTAQSPTSAKTAVDPPPPPPPPDRRLSVTVIGAGTVTFTTPAGSIDCVRSCTRVVAAGRSVTLSAKTTAKFSGWTGPCAGQTATCRFTVAGDAQITAKFVALTPVVTDIIPPATLVGGTSATFTAKVMNAVGSWNWTASTDTGTDLLPGTTDGSYTVDLPAAGYVKVTVTLQVGSSAPYQETFTVAVSMPAPVQLSPADGSMFTNFPRTTTLTWGPVTGAAQYHVEVECLSCVQAGQFSPWGQQSSGLTSFSFTWVGDNQGRWRVTAIAADGVTTGATSGWWTFNYNTTVQTPAQQSPADGSVFSNFPRTTTFTWNTVPGAATYHVEVACLDCQTIGVYTVRWQQTSAQTSYTMSFVGAQPGRWRVTAISATGTESAPSPWWSFRYTV